eukprot:CAMPEP_0206501008 /NCGR_PEP_ID=MMETSP0324_2-20121206/52994_1 /ASSEMBLY_ACC=CAM_ASM_000836 /TAXON_ID=2866 /ORGANISM="Crypthecodinium cohnii, Strain Seligo" /LENGTH=351 /DNA_ID=CAMNT_0053988625 /DNA_START=439 /DNA_END=1491 /DNA_ORIENTATION=-
MRTLRAPPNLPLPPPLLLLLLASFASFAASSYVPPTKYLIVSNARNGTIGYAKLSPTGEHGPVRPLIDQHLAHPQGIAVDQKRQLLLVADSELRKVVSYGLILQEDGSLSVDEQVPVAEDVESRWVAVDGLGNIYLTDEDKGEVQRVLSQQILDGDTQPKVVLSEATATGVKAPGGIATDNFNVYWTNKEQGDKLGTVMKALPSPAQALATHPPSSTAAPSLAQRSSEVPKALSKELPKAYGVCLALDTLYFTGAESSVYAVKHRNSGATKDMGKTVELTSGLLNPRGCVWDGESTIYVADRSANAVYSLPGPVYALAEVNATKAIDFEGAFGVAIFSRATRSNTWGTSVL